MSLHSLLQWLILLTYFRGILLRADGGQYVSCLHQLSDSVCSDLTRIRRLNSNLSKLSCGMFSFMVEVKNTSSVPFTRYVSKYGVEDLGTTKGRNHFGFNDNYANVI
jgi:hypothetical protein